MGLKKIILGGNEFQLTTKTEQRLFELVCFERKQNQDLVRFVEELNRDIKDQQELLENLAEHLKIYKNTDNINHDDSDVEDFPPYIPQDSKDEEGPLSDQETEPEPQKNIRKRKLSASSDEDELIKKNDSEQDDLIRKNDSEQDDLIRKNDSKQDDLIRKNNSEQDDLIMKNDLEQDDLIMKNDSEQDDLIKKNESNEEDENKSQ